LGSGDPTARGEADGVVVELWLDRTEVAIGDVVLAKIKVSNNATVALTRDTNSCGLGPAPTKVQQNDDANAVALGVAWPGRAGVFKRELISKAGLGARRDLGEFVDATMLGRNVTCVRDGRESPFAPGSSSQLMLAWQASAPDGSVIVPGPTVIRSTFESWQWQASAAPVIKVTAEAQIAVVKPDASDGPVPPTLVDYADAALSVDSFRNWIDNAFPGTRFDPTYTFWPSAAGEWPDVAPYTNIERHAVVEIGAVIWTEEREVKELRAVVIDRFTGNVLALRTE
jgi:hypothetical protein